jgi:multiple sugar transport system substrate-binding protein
MHLLAIAGGNMYFWCKNPFRKVVIALFIIWLTACNLTQNIHVDNPIDTMDGRATISFAAFDRDKVVYEALAKRFMEEHSDINVVIVSLDDLQKGFIEQVGHSSSLLDQRRWILSHADTTSSSYITSEVIEHRFILDLLPLMEADASFDRTDFYTGTLEQFMTSQDLWALPRYRKVNLLSYNKELFETLNIPSPRSGWNWDEVFSTAEQIARKQGNTIETYGLLDSTGAFAIILEWLQDSGIDLTKMMVDEVNFSHPDLVQVIEQIRQLRDKGALVVPNYMDPDNQQLDIVDIRRSGRLGMWSESYFRVSEIDNQASLQETLPFEVGKVAYPNDSTFYFGEGEGEGYVISSGTAHPQESWQWIEFLSRQPGTVQSSTFSDIEAPLIPARKSVAEQIHFWEDLDAETSQAYRWALEQIPSIADRPRDYRTLEVFGEISFKIIDETEKSSQTLLTEVQQKLDEQLKFAALAPTPEVSRERLVVATPESLVLNEQGTNITFAVHGRSPANMKQLIKNFREQHPDIRVHLRSTNTVTRSLAGLAETSDCFMWSGLLPEEAKTNLMDIQPIIDADKAFSLADYRELLIAPYRSDSKLYGLPYTVRINALHYNRDSFTAANLASPNTHWTPDDFLAAALATTHGSESSKYYGYVPYSGVYPDLVFFINQFGGRLTTGSGKNLLPNFTSSKVIEAIKWYIDLSKVHQVTPSMDSMLTANGGGSETAMQLVQNGHAAMWFGGSYRMILPSKDTGQQVFEEGLAPLPIKNAGLHAEDLYLQSLHISKHSQNALACWKWLSFLSNDGSVAGWPGVLPARIPVAKSVVLPKEASSEEQKLFEESVELLEQSDHRLDSYVTSLDVINPYWFLKAIRNSAVQGLDLAEQLAEAQRVTIEFIECTNEVNDSEECALIVDSTYQE